MWIETDTYIGPCRREARRKPRLFDRRRWNSSDRDPSLASLLRQLQSGAQSLGDEIARRRFRLRLTATVDVALRQRAAGVAAPLERLASLTDIALADPRNGAAVERYLMQALEALQHR